MRKTRLRLLWASAIVTVVLAVTLPLAVWAFDNPTGNCSGAAAAHTCTDTTTPVLVDAAQSAATFLRSSTASLADAFGLGVPRTSTAGLVDTAQSAATFFRSSAASLADAFGLGAPRTSTAGLVDAAQSAAALGRGSTASLADATQSAATFPRSEAAGLGDTFGLGLPRSETPSLADTAQSAAAYGRADAATLQDFASFGYFDDASVADFAGLGYGIPPAESASVADTGLIFALGVGLSAGWSTFSIPIAAQNGKFFATTGLGTSSQDGLVDPDQVLIAFKFDAATQTFKQIVTTVTDTATQVANSDPVLPTEVVLVQSSAAHSATLILQTAQTNPPTRTLSGGWNLVGLAVPPDTVTKQVDQALITVLETPSGLAGYTVVVSPSFNPDPFVWTKGEGAGGVDLTRWRGYWVFMENTDTLAGFSSTPLQP